MALAPCWYAANKNQHVPTNNKRMIKQLAEYLPARTAAPPQACRPRCVANEIVEPLGTKSCNQRGKMFRPRRASTNFKQNCHAINAKKSQWRKLRYRTLAADVAHNQIKTNEANIIVAIARAATAANCKRSRSAPVPSPQHACWSQAM